MSTGEALTAAGSTLRRHFGKIFAIGCLSYLVTFAILFGTGRVIRMLVDIQDPVEYWRSMSVLGKLCWMLAFVFAEWLPQLTTHAGAAWIASRDFNGETSRLRDALRVVLAKLPVLALLAMLIGVPALLGVMVLIVPGLIVSAIGLMIVPGMIIRELPLGRAISEGIRIGCKHMLTTLVLLLGVGAAGVVLTVISSPVARLESPLLMILFLAGLPFLGGLAASVIGATLAAVCLGHHRSSPAPAPPSLTGA